MTRRMSIEDRFWAKVEKTETCWLWTACKFSNGYGQFQRVDGGTKVAHRIAYELLVGDIPEGLVLDHVCHVRTCVNPAHLRPVTNKQNVENASGLMVTNKSGFAGVHWNEWRGKWMGAVKHDRKHYFVGYFDRAEEAHAAALAKRLELFTHNDLDRVA